MQFLKLAFALVCVLFLEIAANENRVKAACPEDSLPCDDNSQCVKRIKWCDRNKDCQDESDEAYCKRRNWFLPDPNKCQETHFLCDNGRCVPLVAKCDGFTDCKCEDRRTNCVDGSDEMCEQETTVVYDDYYPNPEEPTTEHTISETFSDDFEEVPTTTDTPFGSSTTNLNYYAGERERHSSQSVFRGAHQSECGDGEYSCGLSDHIREHCFPRSAFCNGNYDCLTGRDEMFCDDFSTRRYGGCPSDWWKCEDGRCILSQWKCNGLVDCLDESDESGCPPPTSQAPPHSTIATILARDRRTLGDGMAKRKLLDWFAGRRKNGIKKWGHELPRIAVALFLAEREFFEPGNRTMEEMNYELTIQLLSQMAGGGNLKKKDLSLYIHALLVTCVDPRNFHGRDLVSELRSIVDSGNETASSFDLLVLCNAGDTMTDKDAEKITAAFDSQHRPFWTDNQAMATLALACISSRPGVKVDERTVMDMAQELKKRQFRNGTVDNLKTTALVVQALIATLSLQRDFDLEAALRVLQNAQREDGSIGSFLDSYYILPVLANSSLLNVTSTHCKRPTTSEAEALSELQSARGQRLVIQFSVWIGSEVDLRRTWTLKVPVNSSLYNVLETVNRLDTRQQVLYNVLEDKPYVSSMMGLQDDVETGVYWFTYIRNTKDDDPTLVVESPVDVKIRPNQELILWYKSGQWSKLTTES